MRRNEPALPTEGDVYPVQCAAPGTMKGRGGSLTGREGGGRLEVIALDCL